MNTALKLITTMAKAWEQLGHIGEAESIERLVINHGREFTPADLPKWCPRMKARHCFENAFRVVAGDIPSLTRPRLRALHYCEGFGVPKGVPIPLHHAWLCDDEHNVIDPTWETPGECAYFGIKFNIGFVLDTVSASETYGVIDCPSLGWPLLSGKVDMRKAVAP